MNDTLRYTLAKDRQREFLREATHRNNARMATGQRRLSWARLTAHSH